MQINVQYCSSQYCSTTVIILRITDNTVRANKSRLLRMRPSSSGKEVFRKVENPAHQMIIRLLVYYCNITRFGHRLAHGPPTPHVAPRVPYGILVDPCDTRTTSMRTVTVTVTPQHSETPRTSPPLELAVANFRTEPLFLFLDDQTVTVTSSRHRQSTNPPVPRAHVFLTRRRRRDHTTVRLATLLQILRHC
jgi:hypothetical protein